MTLIQEKCFVCNGTKLMKQQNGKGTYEKCSWCKDGTAKSYIKKHLTGLQMRTIEDSRQTQKYHA
jgi:hypothetical protein